MPEQKRYRAEAASALAAVRKEVRWKPGKDVRHLEKRKALGHLPQGSSLKDYNSLIGELTGKEENLVYLYEFSGTRYYAVRGELRGAEWLVILDRDGLIETAFPPDDIESYLEKRGFHPLGKIGEVLRWEK